MLETKCQEHDFDTALAWVPQTQSADFSLLTEDASLLDSRYRSSCYAVQPMCTCGLQQHTACTPQLSTASALLVALAMFKVRLIFTQTDRFQCQLLAAAHLELNLLFEALHLCCLLHCLEAPALYTD